MSDRGLSIGIDGYRHGWVAAEERDGEIGWRTARLPEVGDLLATGAIVGVDMPVGLADEGWRDCDRLAKEALGSAGSRVFMTPPRQVLSLGLTAPNDEVQEVSRRLTGQGTSRQAMALSERILVLDAALTGDATVIEVHPELSFMAMAGRPLSSKKTARGVGQRLHHLRDWIADPETILAAAPADVPVDDALDALAALWSALRWRDGRARTLPAEVTGPPFIAF